VQGNASDAAKAIAKSLLSGERKAILLGNAARTMPTLRAAGAGASGSASRPAPASATSPKPPTPSARSGERLPGQGGLNAGQMLAGGLKAVLLLNNEPEFDSAAGAAARWPAWARRRWS
jgi:NADH-quinone oxidoreductase subunit G